ncbi:tail fiber assembly protein [Aeromonas veronii]|uniref:tail fiber assembly protein n=1 Tax=Aeromonas sp. 601027 TaxID=2712036 RepID=UPI003A1D9D7C
MWARIENNVVMETTNTDPSGRYYEGLNWMECSDDVAPGWIVSGKDMKPPLSVEMPPEDKALYQLADCLASANQQIAIIKPAVDGGYAKPEHTQLLADWQRYRYELTLVQEHDGWPESPQWPTEPDRVI